MPPFYQILNNIIIYILQPIVVLMFAIALVSFLYGVVKFIKGSSDGDGMEEGKGNLLWGSVGMLIMVSAYGIINFILSTIKVPPPNNLGF